jgi:hypothetical protein
MGLLLITEDNFDGVQASTIEESTSGKKKYFIEGIFLQAEQKNRNGRIYESRILEKEVERFTQEYINKNRALGELNHPESPSVNPERACHIIRELRREGNNWIGKSQVTTEGLGKIVRGLIEDGVQLGVSSRGLGTLREENGIKYVNEDYYMSTIDVVSDPSAPDAWVQGIYEGKEFYVEGNEDLVNQTKKQIDNEARKIGFSLVEEEILAKAFSNFLNEIKA